MQVEQNASLSTHNTFGIDAKASHLAAFESIEDLEELRARGVFEEPHLILGGGSNVLLTQDFSGWVLLNRLGGKEVLASFENEVTVRFAAGENWHQCVSWCIEKGYGGIENLALIPGTVGAAPMQNIGAYGVEIKDVFVKLTAFNKLTGSVEEFDKDSCGFGYRESVFKNLLKGQYVILSVVLQLTNRDHKLKLSYGAIGMTLDEQRVTEPTIRDVFNAVIAIRQSKLPDPKDIGNAGSFFKNPILATDEVDAIHAKNPEMPVYPSGDGKKKIAAGWLIEQCGWKGKRVGATGAHAKQALVLVNYGGAKGSDVWALAMEIQRSVKTRFGIELQPEVNVF